MTLFSIILFLHSFVRWAIVALLLVLLTRNIRGAQQPWKEWDERLHVMLVAAADIQLLLGLFLYFSSSGIAHVFQTTPGAMKNGVLRFFGVEHGFSALLALIVLHIGRAKVRRASGAHARRRPALISLAIAALLIAFTIPWPFLPYGRPLLPHF
jgi:hypothetical protein